MFCLGNHGCFLRVPNDNLSALVHLEYLDIERLRDHRFKMKDKMYAVFNGKQLLFVFKNMLNGSHGIRISQYFSSETKSVFL
jgi:hypothetical protein